MQFFSMASVGRLFMLAAVCLAVLAGNVHASCSVVFQGQTYDFSPLTKGFADALSSCVTHGLQRV
jgi:hypothetical protein